MQIADQDQNAGSDVLHFDFIFASLHTNTVSFSREMLILYILVDKISPSAYPDAYIGL